MRRDRGFAAAYGYLIATVLIVAALAGLYAWGHSNGRAACQAEWDAAKAGQREKEQKQSQAVAVKLEDSNAKSKVVFRTITRNVDRIIDRPIYRDGICFDSDGLRHANDALRGAIAAPAEPDGKVPGPDAARGRDRGISAEKDSGDRGAILRLR